MSSHPGTRTHDDGEPALTTHTSRDLVNRLRNRYSGPHELVGYPTHVVLREVPVVPVYSHSGGVTAGRYNGRRIDAVAVGIWGSTSNVVHGFEVKVSRSDWLNELKDPDKALSGMRYCDRWWLVAPEDVLRDDLPDGWGWLAPHGKGLRVKVDAPVLTPIRDPRFYAQLVGCAAMQHFACKRHVGDRNQDAAFERGMARGRTLAALEYAARDHEATA